MIERKIRVLIIEDSAFNRRVLSDILGGETDIEVIGKACDGEEGLEIALKQNPDVICLDLEMPRMGGYPFLRILLSKKLIPVIVISAHSKPEKVVRALEYGAFDFVAKPTAAPSSELFQISTELVSKVRIAARIDFPTKARKPQPQVEIKRKSIAPRAFADRVVAIAASTGGPQAITRVLTELPEYLSAAVLIVQHMPPKFTDGFARRLNKLCRINVTEASDRSVLQNGTAYIAPGDACIELVREETGLLLRVALPNGTESIVPSADRMFQSVAQEAPTTALGIVLTGMGRDGSAGAKALADAGGLVIAEDESTAVVPGMPAAAVAVGAVQETVPLNRISEFILRFLSR